MTVAILQETELDRLRRRCGELERELEILRMKQRARIAIAADAHQSLLPGPVRRDSIWVDVRYVPIEEVGGDYCQVRFPDPRTCYITMCDVMGHGVGAAILATRVSSEVRYGITYGREPRDIVRSLERFMRQFFADSELFFTFVAARIDLDRMELTYSGAGHPSPLLIRPDENSYRGLTSQNPIVGLGTPDLENVRQDAVALRAGDRLVFFTDGLFEVNNAQGRQLGIDGLARVVRNAADCDLFETADVVLDQIRRYEAGPNTDDQTLIVAELR